MYLSPGLFVYFAGSLLVTLGWGLFRRPGVKLFSFSPIWRHRELVKRPPFHGNAMSSLP